MFSCGKRNRNKSDISKVAAKMAEGSGGSNAGLCTGSSGGGGVVGVGGGGDTRVAASGTTNQSNNCTNNNRRTIQRFSCSRCCSDLFNYLIRLRVSPEELEQRYKSREIDKFLEKDKHAFRRQVPTPPLPQKQTTTNSKQKQKKIENQEYRPRHSSFSQFLLLEYFDVVRFF